MPLFILAFLSFLLPQFAAADQTGGASAGKPNFVIIFADDQGYGDLSCFGSTMIETPHIDRMAREDRRIDGLDASALLTGANSASPRRELLYYSRRGQLEGIRVDQWKLLVKSPGGKKAAQKETEIMLFDIETDPGEQRELSAANPAVVERLRARMAELDAEIAQNKRAPWVQESSAAF